jgi:predicted dehydrogenase
VNGTLFSDAAIHDFDLARCMMKDEITAIHAYAWVLASPELVPFVEVDATLDNLCFSRGGIGNIEAFRKATYGYDIRTEVLGNKGAVHAGYLRQTALRVFTKDGIRHDVINHWLIRFADAYLEELRDFIRKIVADKPVCVTGEDGRKTFAVHRRQSGRFANRARLKFPGMQDRQAQSSHESFGKIQARKLWSESANRECSGELGDYGVGRISTRVSVFTRA